MNPCPTPEALVAVTTEAARKAAAHAHGNRHRRNEVVQAAAHDVKLKLDLECQDIAEAVIRGYFPEHGFIGEENGTDQVLPKTGYHWIVDPIDGTVNFNHGLPTWCCSVAVMNDRRIVAGTVVAPEFDECFTATMDGPARCNGDIIRVSTRETLEESLVFTGTCRVDLPAEPAFHLVRSVSERARKIRVRGSAALDLCHVAAGKGEGYFEAGIYIWDSAAAALVIERAGGRCEQLGGHGPDSCRQRFLASNGLIHDALRRIILPFFT